MRFLIPVVAVFSALACASPPAPYTVRGSCQGGVPDGPYTLVLPNGRTQVEGSYSRGVKEGLFVIYASWGPKVAEVPYHDDVLNGTVKLWYMPDSPTDTSVRRKLESSYAAGLRDGPSASWYRDGAQRSKMTYAKDALVSAEAWDPVGVALSADEARQMAAQA